MLRRLTDPSHQGGQDLQVLGLLDVKEGEGSQEESEDSLGDRNRSEGGPEAGLHTARHVRGEHAVHTASAQGWVSPSPGARWPGRGSLGCQCQGAQNPRDVSLPALTPTVLRLLQRNFQASPRRHPGDIVGSLLLSKH